MSLSSCHGSGESERFFFVPFPLQDSSGDPFTASICTHICYTCHRHSCQAVYMDRHIPHG